MNESLFKNAKVVDIFSELSVQDKINAKNKAKIAVAIFKTRYKLLNMTYKEFADHIGVGESDIIRWENGAWDFKSDDIQILINKIDFDVESLEKL